MAGLVLSSKIITVNNGRRDEDMTDVCIIQDSDGAFFIKEVRNTKETQEAFKVLNFFKDNVVSFQDITYDDVVQMIKLGDY